MNEKAMQEPVVITELKIKELFQKFGTGRLDGFTAAVKEAFRNTTPPAQPAPVPLTLREIAAACGSFSDETIRVVRQTEAAHGIKENT
jgi:hypothetical protein